MECDLYFDSHIFLCLCITLILIIYICLYCVYVREYYEYSPHCQQVTSLAAAVRAPYLCALPSASYFSAIGHTLPTAAAALSL